MRRQVVLRMSKELPLVVEYRIADLGSLSFYLAPKACPCLPAFLLLTAQPAMFMLVLPACRLMTMRRWNDDAASQWKERDVF